jgi:hypothetical protein
MNTKQSNRTPASQHGSKFKIFRKASKHIAQITFGQITIEQELAIVPKTISEHNLTKPANTTVYLWPGFHN